jgi:hypothetical protein
MAMHAGKIATGLIHEFLQHRISRDHMENLYTAAWKQQFSARLRTGRLVQSAFGKSTATNLFIKTMRKIPALTNLLIKQTHGQPY